MNTAISNYTASLLSAISALNAEIKYLPLLPDKDLDALASALESLRNRVDYERTSRLLNSVRRAS